MHTYILHTCTIACVNYSVQPHTWVIMGHNLAAPSSEFSSHFFCLLVVVLLLLPVKTRT